MSDDYEEPGSEFKKSAMNSAIAILYRIDGLWKDAHRHAREVNYQKWNEDLDRVWLELVEDAKPGNKDKGIVGDKETINYLNTKLMAVCIYGLSEKLRKKNPQLYSKLINLQKKLLMEKEEFLREMQKQQGKSSKYEDDIEGYMD